MTQCFQRIVQVCGLCNCIGLLDIFFLCVMVPVTLSAGGSVYRKWMDVLESLVVLVNTPL